MDNFSKDAGNFALIERIIAILQTANILSLELDLWKAQNIFFAMGRKDLGGMVQKSKQLDEDASKWLKYFESLGTLLKVKVD